MTPRLDQIVHQKQVDSLRHDALTGQGDNDE